MAFKNASREYIELKVGDCSDIMKIEDLPNQRVNRTKGQRKPPFAFRLFHPGLAAYE